MILFKKTMISTMQAGVMLLEVNDGDDGFIYVSKLTYDQSIRLHSRFDGELYYLNKTIGGTEHQDAVEYFFDNAPEPINILAPFLGLVKADVDLKLDIRELCGVLHQLSMSINFELFSIVPADIRADTTFSKSMIKGYEASWADIEERIQVDDIDLDSISLEAIGKIIEKIAPVIGGGTVITQPSQQVSYAQAASVNTGVSVQTEEDDEDDFDWDAFNEGMDEILAGTTKPENEDKVKEEKESEPAPKQEPEPEPTIKTKEEEEKEAMFKLIAHYSKGGTNGR